MCSDLAVEEVICAARANKNSDGLLFKKSSNFHLQVGVADQRVHYVVSRLGLFLHGFIFKFKAFFRWFVVLILYWFNHEESALFAAMFSAPRFIIVPTQPLDDHSQILSLVNFFGAGARMTVEGADGLSVAGRGVTLVFVVQSFFLDSFKGNRRHKSVRLSRLYFSSNLQL
ncbi:hypothetical protein B296_00027356 [Ensete ventricosum]|uniref:Uncharacterized protein n=1 Tax=Ensete ventricosum TaxID=4639 RepID=A0A427A2C3_ENSVE|nr:hypothetical protein B296_00027356 [Ensete ventricosum]